MPAPRKGISKKTRFEVFKRDAFTCQYCGKCAPEIILRVDHIHPVSAGGEDDVMNLITACFDCNAGKGARLLADDTVIQKQRAQLEELSERREQLEMMLQWREGMKDINEQGLEAFHDAVCAAAPGWHLNDNGLTNARKFIKKFGLQACLDALDIAATQYFKFDKEGKVTQESFEIGFMKIGGICRLANLPDAERELYYIRGILRNRLSYVNYNGAMQIMRDAIAAGGEVEHLTHLAKECRSWTQFHDWVNEYTTELRNDLWWQTEEGTLVEGRRLGLSPNPGEEMADYRWRIRRAREEG